MLLFVATILNSVLIQKSTPKEQSTNSSFHRIYSNCDEDLSENSDAETTRYSDSFSSAHRSRKGDSLLNLNNSFNSVKSSPSMFKSTPWMSSANNLNHSFRSEFQHSPCYQQSNENLFSQHNSNDRLHRFPQKPIDDRMRCSSMLGLNSSFRTPDDYQNRLADQIPINNLNISGISRRNDNHKITCSSPTPSTISLNRRRSQLLTPARLNFNSHSSLTAPVTQTSWVAGGFFVKNNMSPQKRQQAQSVLLHPILSRTSSQSSGFESQASSVHNNQNGSRESSIAGDVVSNFSEPTLIADSASQMGINYCPVNSMSQLPRPEPFFPILNQSESTFIDSASCKPESCTNYHTYSPWTNHSGNKILTSPSLSPQPVYHQFGLHRHSFYNNDSMYNKFSQHSPAIRKGNLLKPMNDAYFFDNK